jgi:hypothetical protein
MSHDTHDSVWFMCLNPYSKNPPMVRHTSYYKAQQEALRMATKTGQKCHVLQLKGTAQPPQPPSATWHPREQF